MSEKYYELIAKVLKSAWYPPGDEGDDCRQMLAGDMADALAGANSAFDRTSFLAACGVSFCMVSP